MAEVIFDCDRCGTEVVGQEYEQFTAGYYDVRPGSGWHVYAQDGESRICDSCMWANAGYIAIYGERQ